MRWIAISTDLSKLIQLCFITYIEHKIAESQINYFYRHVESTLSRQFSIFPIRPYGVATLTYLRELNLLMNMLATIVQAYPMYLHSVNFWGTFSHLTVTMKVCEYILYSDSLVNPDFTIAFFFTALFQNIPIIFNYLDNK